MYSALEVAAYIIEYCNNNNYSISNLKLQKLLYFVQAQFLVSKDEPCFPEPIEAWDFGPVVPVVYRKYKAYGSATIPYFGKSISYRINENDRYLVDSIVNVCAKYTASSLVEITHRQDPWVNAYMPYRSNVITNKSIKDFFEQ